MITLSVAQVKWLHALLLAETGGLAGVRDERLLESALFAPFQTMFGEELYASMEEQAAQMAYALIKNHAFVDGNKSVGMLAMLTFLELNGIILDADDADIIQLGFSVAEGSVDKAGLLNWILAHKPD